MIYDLLEKAQQGDKNAMQELIDRFQPLLRKYARKLGYDDAYEDCLLFFIELVKKMNMKRLKDRQDQVAVSYIRASVVNFYKKRICKIIEEEREIAFSELTEEQKYYIEARTAKQDEVNIFTELGIDKLLSEEEQMVIYLVYAQGYTIAEIARRRNKSRQTVNQLKQRTLSKLKNMEL